MSSELRFSGSWRRVDVMTARSPTFDDVNTAALAAYPGMLSQLFPKGHLCGREFCVGNLQGEPGESLGVNSDR